MKKMNTDAKLEFHIFRQFDKVKYALEFVADNKMGLYKQMKGKLGGALRDINFESGYSREEEMKAYLQIVGTDASTSGSGKQPPKKFPKRDKSPEADDNESSDDDVWIRFQPSLIKNE
jgi:hypothetical protein